MKKLLSITTVLCALSFPVMASARDDMPASSMEKAISQLPTEKAENFRDTLQQAHEDNKDLYDKAHTLRTQLHDILVAPEFDKDAFVTKSAELRDVHNSISANLDVAFADADADLSQSERQQMAQCMEHDHKMMKKQKKAAK